MVLHVQTIFSNAVAAILRQLDASLLKYSRSTSRVLFSIAPSDSLPADELSQLVGYFQALKNERVGCLSAPVRITDGRSHRLAPTWCSVAVFDEDSATAFRSNIPGREVAHVGRWHASRRREEHGVEIPLFSTTVSPKGFPVWETSIHALPKGLQSLRPTDVDTILYFSDNAPEGLVNTLTTAFADANQLGIIASSTPFITGRPVTLFHNASILSNGAVGLCLHSTSPPVAAVEFPTLAPLTGDFVVTQAEGNLIHSLNDQNPSRLLLDAINKHPSQNRADLKCYVAVCDGPTLKQMYAILSGDPSRGSIALEGENAPEEGSTVRIYCLPPSVGTHSVESLINDAEMEFLTAEATDSVVLNFAADSSCGVLQNRFLACTENGLITGLRTTAQKTERPWRLVMPGARVKLRWTNT